MVNIGDPVGNLHNPALQGGGFLPSCVAQNAVPNLLCQVQALTVLFQLFHHPDALLIVPEAARYHSIQSTFPRMAERGMSQIVAQRNRLCQIFVQPQGPGDGPGDLGNLQGMGQPSTVMIPLRRKKHLGFPFQAAERLTVDDPVTVSPVAGADIARLLRRVPAQAFFRQCGIGSQHPFFQFLRTFPNRHAFRSFPDKPLLFFYYGYTPKREIILLFLKNIF